MEKKVITRGLSLGTTKGQLISKGFGGILNFSKKRTKIEKSTYITTRLTCFRSFFGRIEDTEQFYRN